MLERQCFVGGGRGGWGKGKGATKRGGDLQNSHDHKNLELLYTGTEEMLQINTPKPFLPPPPPLSKFVCQLHTHNNSQNS